MLNKKNQNAMKNQSENLMAAQAVYAAPTVELFEVSVEKGFAGSKDEEVGDGEFSSTIGGIQGL
jgi:hypothetical protein